MTEQRSPDTESIIELTEVVEPSAADDNDIIELTEVVASSPKADEDIIELTDIVKSRPVEEAILDLVDVVEETPEAETTDVNELPEGAEAAQHKSLVEDIAEESATAPENAAFDLFHEEASESAASSDDAALDGTFDFAPMDLDIEENKEADLFDSLGMKLEPELQGAAENDELDFNLSTQELSDAIDLLDAKLAEDPPVDTPSDAGKAVPFPSTITEAQLEKALENVIRRMYAEKIDLLLNEAIEKNVTTEIENLKHQLLKESPED